MRGVNESRNPRYTWSVILIIVAVVIISAAAAFIYQINRPESRHDTGFINPSAIVQPGPGAHSESPQATPSQ